MLLIPVQSSNLYAMGYDGATGELQVQFRKNGAIYAYHNVPEVIYMGLVNAPSKGEFFAYNIRNQPMLYTPLRIL